MIARPTSTYLRAHPHRTQPCLAPNPPLPQKPPPWPGPEFETAIPGDTDLKHPLVAQDGCTSHQGLASLREDIIQVVLKGDLPCQATRGAILDDQRDVHQQHSHMTAFCNSRGGIEAAHPALRFATLALPHGHPPQPSQPAPGRNGQASRRKQTGNQSKHETPKPAKLTNMSGPEQPGNQQPKTSNRFPQKASVATRSP